MFWTTHTSFDRHFPHRRVCLDHLTLANRVPSSERDWALLKYAIALTRRLSSVTASERFKLATENSLEWRGAESVWKVRPKKKIQLSWTFLNQRKCRLTLFEAHNIRPRSSARQLAVSLPKALSHVPTDRSTDYRISFPRRVHSLGSLSFVDYPFFHTDCIESKYNNSSN